MTKDVRRDIANRDLGRALGRKIARLERHVRELETASQAAFRSVEDGALDFYDDDGVLRERIGKQADGSWGRVVKEGPIPPAPTEPDVQVISDGVVAITWDGRTEEKWPIAEFRMVRVHLGDTSDFTPDRDNQVGAIWAARGGTIVAVTESDDDNPVWVKLAAVSTAGHWTESAAVLVDELDEDDLEEEPEELEWEDGDGHTLTAEDIAAGTVTFGLSHIPEQEAVLGWWHPGGLGYAGVPQAPGVDFTVDYEAATVTWPLTDAAKVDDRLRVYYPYYDATTVLVDWQSDGWSHLQITLADSTNRSAVGFDDSTWSVDSAPYGDSVGVPYDYPLTGKNWPAPVTLFPGDTALWLRREVDVPAPGGVIVRLRADNNAAVYWNGALVYDSGAGTGIVDTSVSVAAEDVTVGVNTLAIRFSDDSASNPAEHTYADARVEMS